MPGRSWRPDGAGWALSTTTFDNAYTATPTSATAISPSACRPPAWATSRRRGDRLAAVHPRYDGAFVAGLYSTRAGPADPAARRDDRGDPDLVDAERRRRRRETYSATTPAGQISNFRQTLFLRCGVAAHVADLDAPRRPGDRPRLRRARRARSTARGAVRLTMTPHWSGPATVTDLIDGAGARRVIQTGGGAVAGRAHRRRRLPTHDRDRRRGRVDAETAVPPKSATADRARRRT